MGQEIADLSRNIFDEEKLYTRGVVPQSRVGTSGAGAVVMVDADENDHREAVNTKIRRLVQGAVGDGYPAGNDGFKVEGTGATNNFTVKGGGGTGDTAGLLFLEGFACRLFSDTVYDPGAVALATGPRSLYPRITGLAPTLLTDSAANWVVGELIGRALRPNIEDATVFIITGNTLNTITVVGDMLANALPGDSYLIELSVPAAPPRTDEVYLNVYEDEFDGQDDDTNLAHPIIGPQQLRKKLIQSLFVREDVGTHGVLANYVDADGHQHYILKIATLVRNGAALAPGEVTDNRPVLLFTLIGQDGQGIALGVTGANPGIFNQNPTPAWVSGSTPLSRITWDLGAQTLTLVQALLATFILPSGVVQNTISAAAVAAVADGDVLYVDLDRSAAGPISVQKSAGFPATTADRVVLCFRSGADIFWRDGRVIQDSGTFPNKSGLITPPAMHSDIYEALTQSLGNPSAALPFITTAQAGIAAAPTTFLTPAALVANNLFVYAIPASTRYVLIYSICNAGLFGVGNASIGLFLVDVVTGLATGAYSLVTSPLFNTSAVVGPAGGIVPISSVAAGGGAQSAQIEALIPAGGSFNIRHTIFNIALFQSAVSTLLIPLR